MLRERIIRDFMDVIILAQSNSREAPFSGYDIIHFVHRRFNILLSSGTVYALLYSMEREGLIKGKWTGRKRVYMLTEKGNEAAEEAVDRSDEILSLVKQILRGENASKSPRPLPS